MERCEIIRDLLPVYIDGLASEETAKLVEDHLAQCEQCRTILAQMRAPVPVYDPVKASEFQKVLKKQRNRNTKKIVLFSALAGFLTLVLLAAMLWVTDVFYYIGTYESPNGQVKTTVYNRDVTEFIPVKDHFTLIDKGYFSGRTVLWGEFDGLWWSHDSNYQVVSLMDDGECWLTLFDYVRNTGNNLDNRLEQGIYGMEEFENVSRDMDGRRQIEFRFLQWSKYDNSMLVYFSYLDIDGVDRDGYFWYNYDSGEASGVTHMETMVLCGVVKEIGADFYLMDLDMPDSDGNVREFAFRISAQMSLRGLNTVRVGDHIQLVFHGPEEYAQTPWDMVFGQPTRNSIPTVISVTAME